jgi:hypothetical protein
MDAGITVMILHGLIEETSLYFTHALTISKSLGDLHAETWEEK